MNIGCHLGI